MRKFLLFHIFIFVVFASCGEVKEDSNIPNPIELSDFETIVSYDEAVLANPQRLRFDDDKGLIVFDSGLEKVVWVSLGGIITQEIGRKGSGPGEYQSISNIYLLDDSIFLVDDRQFIIHQFSQDGLLISSMVYGEFGTHRINKPIVINQNEFLLPNSKADQALYKFINHNGVESAQLGQIPEGSVDELDYDVYRNAVSNREVPPYFNPHVFSVNNNGESLFIVYEALPKIGNYDYSGELLWETEPIDVPEIDSVATKYYDFMDMVLRQANAVRPLRKYIDGVSKNARLFVSTNTDHNNPLWIHEFEDGGNLVNRFLLKSEVGLKSYFDIDTDEQRIFVLTEEGEIRAYSY